MPPGYAGFLHADGSFTVVAITPPTDSKKAEP